MGDGGVWQLSKSGSKKVFIISAQNVYDRALSSQEDYAVHLFFPLILIIILKTPFALLD